MIYNKSPGPSRAREALADLKTDASGTMDSHLHAVSGVSSCYPSSETKMNPRKKVKSRSVTRRDEPPSQVYSRRYQTKQSKQ
jgi:hypothetical protein